MKVCDPAMGSGAFLVEACRQLADVLIAAWKAHSITPVIPPDEDIVLYARRIVAQRCLYGVDRNPMATDLAKLSLWLATLAKDHPFTFLDHALRTGDTLVGLSRKQIEAFHWDTTKPPTFIQHELATRIEAALRTRRLILEAGDQMVPGIKAQKLAIADDTLQLARDLGDACISAFFSADKPKAREERRGALLTAIENYLTRHDYTDAGGKAVLDAAKFRRTGARPFPPFHWEIEFPEVFNRENSGFDAIVGNPPFLGGTRISTVAGMDYFQWLVTTYPPCGHLCDLVAYFFRRAFALLRVEGTFGLIATNTIAQGDTREGGLRVILGDGGQIYDATRRFKWPGSVAVVVSVVHVAKGLPFAPPLLDGTHVSRISAFLANGQTDDSPARLCRNPYFSLGSKIYGQGFLFDDGDPECTSTHERDRIVAAQPSAGSRIRPYIGGEEILSDPRHQYHRYVILFTDVDKESDLNQWPDLKAIVQAKVKPERDVLGNNPNNVPLKRKWWAFQAHRPELYLRLSRMKQVLVTSQVNPQFGFAILPADWIYSQKAVVLCVESYAGFAAVQSRCHESWSRFFGSTSMELMNYTPSDCFETFPFPPAFETAPELEHAGHAYYDFRAALMTDLWLGLTDTYNLFHAPDHEALERLRQLFAKRAANSDWRTAEKVPADCSPFTLYPTPESALAAIIRLRELHAAMDRAVLDAYGWTDIPTACEFILDYDDAPEAEADTEAAKPSRRKKPWRYRWPDSVRDEVLARLLALNAERAEEERLAGLATTATKVVSVVANPRKRAVKAITAKQPDFLEAMAFPSTDHDCALCAALLEIVQRCDGAPSNAHLNTLLLAAHPEWCATFLPETRRAAAIPSLTGNPKQPLQWAECRDYLLQRKAITMDRQHTGHPIGVGPQHARVTTEFACNVSQTVTMAQEALARIEKLVPTEERQLPADQQIVISTLRREERVLAGVDI